MMFLVNVNITTILHEERCHDDDKTMTILILSIV